MIFFIGEGMSFIPFPRPIIVQLITVNKCPINIFQSSPNGVHPSKGCLAQLLPNIAPYFNYHLQCLDLVSHLHHLLKVHCTPPLKRHRFHTKTIAKTESSTLNCFTKVKTRQNPLGNNSKVGGSISARLPNVPN